PDSPAVDTGQGKQAAVSAAAESYLSMTTTTTTTEAAASTQTTETSSSTPQRAATRTTPTTTTAAAVSTPERGSIGDAALEELKATPTASALRQQHPRQPVPAVYP